VAVTLGAGTFSVGADVRPGRYVIATSESSGNFQVENPKDPLKVNEILGTEAIVAVPTVTTDLAEGDTIKIKGLSAVTFTPATTELLTDLSSGSWIVGLDIAPGRYVVTPVAGSGNLFVGEVGGFPEVNEILGGDYGVESVTVDLIEGWQIDIIGMASAHFEAV
jgi:hypothetical protein